MQVRFYLLMCLFSWSAVAGTGMYSAELPPAALGADYLLLGEVHDNPDGHALRLQWLKELLVKRPMALAMEQFDLDHEKALETALTQASPSEKKTDAAPVRAVAEAGGFNFKGWRWPLYEPVVALAIELNTPLYPANLSRKKLGEIMMGQRPPPAGKNISPVRRASGR